MENYSVYRHINKVNGKSYIGITRNTVEFRRTQHAYNAFAAATNPKITDNKFYKAIRKYGTDNFDVEVLESGLSAEQAKEREIYYISLFDTYNTGYNSTFGGDGINGYGKPIVGIHIATREIVEFDSVNQAADHIDAFQSNVSMVLAGTQSHSKGWFFVYADEFDATKINDYLAKFVSVDDKPKQRKSEKRWTYATKLLNGEEQEFVTLDEIAKFAGMSIASVHRNINSGKLVAGYNIYKKLA